MTFTFSFVSNLRYGCVPIFEIATFSVDAIFLYFLLQLFDKIMNSFSENTLVVMPGQEEIGQDNKNSNGFNDVFY